ACRRTALSYGAAPKGKNGPSTSSGRTGPGRGCCPAIGTDMEDDFLPPGFDEAKFAQGMRAFEAALGADKVFFDSLDRTAYRDKFAVREGTHVPAGWAGAAAGRGRGGGGAGPPT